MLKKNPTQSKLLTIRQAADILNVHVETLRRWDKTGKLKAIKVNDRGDRRYKQEDIESFINQSKKIISMFKDSK